MPNNWERLALERRSADEKKTGDEIAQTRKMNEELQKLNNELTKQVEELQKKIKIKEVGIVAPVVPPVIGDKTAVSTTTTPGTS